MQLTAYLRAALHLMILGRNETVAPFRARRTPYRAAIVSAALHLLLGFAILASAPGTVTGGASNVYGDAVEISLASLEGARSGGDVAAHANPLDALFNRLQAEKSDLNAQPSDNEHRSDLAALFEEIEQAHRASARGKEGEAQADAQGRRGNGADSRGDSQSGNETQRSARAGERTRDLSSGALWGQIEPCWRDLPQNSLVPVTLEIELDDRGELAVPPKIIRPMAAALNDRRLVAEARALAAVAACAPLNAAIPRGSQRKFRVEFLPMSGNG